MATLYKGHDPLEGREVALKLLRPYFTQERGLLAAYFSEVQRVAALGHPHILAILGSGDDETPWVATEFIATGSLKEQIGQPVTLREADKLLSQIASALDAAHRAGILHRDLKPSNVFITATGDYKLGDFGMAALAAGAHPLLQTSSATPMPSYMSPEQALNHSLTQRSDVYSLGVLLYHLLTGQVPYSGTDPTTVWAKQMGPPPPPPRQLDSRIPLPVSEVILTAISTNPDKRYASAGEMATAFKQAVGQAGPTERDAPEVLVVPSPQPASHPAWVALGEAEMSEGAGLLYLRCPVCDGPNLPDVTHCSHCGAQVVPAGVLEEEAVAVRRQKVRKGVAVATLALAVFVTSAAFLATAGGSLPAPASSLTAASGPGEWAMHQRGPTHSGFIPGPAPLPEGKLRWSLVMSEPVLSAPAVVGGTVYLATGDRRVVALAADSGEILWEHPVSGPVDAAPAVAGEFVYVGLRDGQLLALDRQTGERQWAFKGSGPIFASPAVKDGVVYFGTGGETVHAVDALTGESYWDLSADGWISSSPAISDDGVLVFGSRNSTIALIDTSNKKSRLKYRATSPIDSSAAIFGDMAYIGSNSGSVLALDLTERRRPFDHEFFQARVRLFIWKIIKNAPQQRGLVWANKVGEGEPITTTPAVTDAFVYATSHDGNLYSLDRLSGQTIWSFASRDLIQTSPIVAGETVYVGSRDGTVYGVDAATGEKVWEWAAGFGSAPTTSPVMGEGVLYVAVSQQRPIVETVQGVGSDDWYYSFGQTPCSPESDLFGPFASVGTARAAALGSAPACGVLYAIE